MSQKPQPRPSSTRAQPRNAPKPLPSRRASVRAAAARSVGRQNARYSQQPTPASMQTALIAISKNLTDLRKDLNQTKAAVQKKDTTEEIASAVWRGPASSNNPKSGYQGMVETLRRLRIPECVKSYIHALSFPTKPTPFHDICNIGGEETKAMYFPNLGRANLVVGTSGEFAIAMNVFCLANDEPSIAYSSPGWSSGGLLDVNTLTNLINPSQFPFKKSELESSGAYQQPNQGRIISAGLCLSSATNVSDTQGTIYIYYTVANQLVQQVAISDIQQNTTSTAVAQLNNSDCYNITFDPATNAQNNWLNGDPALPVTHPYDPANKGACIMVYGQGLKTGTNIFFEYGQHAEFNSVNKFVSLQKSTTYHPQAAAKVSKAISEAKISSPASKPHEGFFDKVIHVVKEVASPIGTLVGNAAKAFFA